MLASKTEKDFLLDQIREISGYLQQFPNQDSNLLAMKWIEKYSASYRNFWQINHQSR